MFFRVNGVETSEIAQSVAPEAIYRDKSLAGICRAIWQRAWTPLLETELRIIELTHAGREAQGRKIHVTLADIVGSLRLEADRLETQQRSA
ncbi:MAG: hypothetical protein A3G87_07500 [Omnitrophica bacterium RIFCSPLOWO2_12_FULL_50_11]|nr:MAG: hypothetical protein A3G87_07500 [Omnitrophica bacterium RIFCSPLOWO2_12_FULL_50_11]